MRRILNFKPIYGQATQADLSAVYLFGTASLHAVAAHPVANYSAVQHPRLESCTDPHYDSDNLFALETAMNELIGKLLNPALYSPPVTRVELLETHISWVLLAGDYAYKIKKAVDFGFLDFSTLEKRRFFCHEELRINRRLAPELYLEVIAIGGSAEHPQFGASNYVIEYAVKMRRFDQAALFDRMLAENRLDAMHIDCLADTIAVFHDNIARSNAEDAHGLPEHIQAAALDNFAHIDPLLPEGTDSAPLDELRAWTLGQYARLESAMQLRKARGFVREGHGDLHLGNIVWLNEQTTAFDAIEFNEKLRWIDVASEVAFTIMDLQAKGRTDLAYRLLNRYWAATGDYAAAALLPYYLVYRAIVRAKIAILSLAQTTAAPARDKYIAQYRRQVGFALDYIHTQQPLLLLCHGLSGSGKSTIAAYLAERLPAVHLRSDVERKRLCGLTATADSRSLPQQGIYNTTATERTYRHLAERAEELLRSGFSVIVDATFLQLWQRDLFKQSAQNCAVPLAILDVQAEEQLLRQRISERLDMRRDASEANIEVLEHQLRQQQPLTGAELQSTLCIDGEQPDLGEILAKLCKLRETAQNRII